MHQTSTGHRFNRSPLQQGNARNAQAAKSLIVRPWPGTDTSSIAVLIGLIQYATTSWPCSGLSFVVLLAVGLTEPVLLQKKQL